jgi:hypothetical protein
MFGGVRKNPSGDVEYTMPVYAVCMNDDAICCQTYMLEE